MARERREFRSRRNSRRPADVLRRTESARTKPTSMLCRVASMSWSASLTFLPGARPARLIPRPSPPRRFRLSLRTAPACNKAELHRPGPSRYFNTRGQFYTDLTPSSGAYRLGADPMEVGHHENSDRVPKACGRLRVSGENSFHTSATCHAAGYLAYLAETS
jgi:hypothetical protein